MKIDFANLSYQHKLYQEEIEDALLKVARNCNFIMGAEISLLENSLQEFTGVNHAITCSSGTDALLLAMMALDIQPGDEIITTPFTFIATAETIALLGAKPVFVDIDKQTYNINPDLIEEKITAKTKAIMPVSLYGQPAKVEQIQTIANQYSLKVIIDGAQSFGSTIKGIMDSNLGDISTTSFFPAKPLGCYGDGGALFTNDKKLAEKIKSLRVHGQTKRYEHHYIGLGGRLDTIQAAVLNIKLKYYKKDMQLRESVAKRYETLLQHKEGIITPILENDTLSSWAQYSIRVQNREALIQKFKALDIPFAIHYPKPLHLQECFKYLDYKKGDFPVSEKTAQEILSLPMNPYLTDEEINYICENI